MPMLKDHPKRRQITRAGQLSRSALALAAAGLLCFGLQSTTARAQERPLGSSRGAPNVVVNKRPIEGAAAVYLTQKGEAYFSKNLESIISANGISIRQGYFPEVRYTSPAPILLSELAKTSPETGQLVQGVRELLQNWFMGLQIKDPRPDVLMTGAGFRVSFARLALQVDREAMKRLGRESGAVFALEAEIDKLDVGGEAIAVRDLNNEFIGSVGMLSPVLSLAPGSQSLKLRVPVYFDVNDRGETIVESLQMESNFSATDLQLSYGQLIVPDISVEINGHKFPLNKNYLTQTFEQMKPQLLNQMKQLIDTMAKESLPGMVNERAKSSLSGALEQVSQIAPPGKPEGSHDPDFLWGLTLRKLGLGSQVLGLELNGYVEDPTNTKVALDPKAGARGRVSLAGSDPTTYDLALTVNRGLINRILQLSYKRGYFNEVEAGPGKKLKLFAAPQIDAYQPTAGKDVAQPQLTIRVAIAQPVSGLQSLAIKGEIRLYVDIVGRLVNVPGAKGLRVQLDSIDESSLVVSEDSLTLLGRTILRSTVESGVKDELRKASAAWKTQPQLIPGDLPLPPELIGQKLAIQSMRMDKNGYLVMFLNFVGTR